MADLYSNNAVGTLADGISDSETEITLLSEPWAAFFAYNETPGDFQRATLTSEDDPLDFEIVYIRVNDNSLTLTVLRGQEDTTPQAWAAGSKLSARVTGGMLAQFPQMDLSGNIKTRDGAPPGNFLVNSRTNAGTAPVQIAGYPVLSLMTASPITSGGTAFAQDHNMAREAVGASIMVDLGDDVPVWTSGVMYFDGSVVAPPTPDGFNYVFQAAGNGGRSQTTTTPSFSGTNSSCDALDSADVSGLWVPIPDPLIINLNFPNSYGLMLTEVGFICMDHDATTDASISVGTSAAPTRFAATTALADVDAAGDVHRIPVTTGGAMVDNLRFTLSTAATGNLVGRFYWRGFFVQMT